MKTLPLSAARTLHLAAQGLLTPPRRKAVKADVLDAIRRMAQLQIDTIHVVARSPYLVLFSRLGAYPQQWLDEHLAEGKLFEYWSHEACFVPTEDYGLLRHRMLDPSDMGWKYAAEWHKKHRKDIEKLLAHIRETGPVRSADFVREAGKGNGWWDWKPEKRHLEVLFAIGQLMVAERRNFHRVYDLTERVLPDWDDARDLPPARSRHRGSCCAAPVARSASRAPIGSPITTGCRAARIATNCTRSPIRASWFPCKWKAGSRTPSSIASSRRMIDDAANGKLASTVTTVLSPFDPVVWDRKRAAALFDFDYAIECYTPAAKRKYGYFVLPLLSRGRLVGRVDAKAHRTNGVFELKSLHIEPGVRLSARLAGDLRRALQRCADWHGTPQLEISVGAAGMARGVSVDAG